MDDLKKLAFEGIAASICGLGASQLVEEAFSVFTARQGHTYEKYGSASDITYRYSELQGLYTGRLRSVLSSETFEDSFRQQLSCYFYGDSPHSKDILTSLLRALMDGATVGNPRCELNGNCNTIPRVSHPWPARTKKALHASLDKGTFEDFHFTVPLGSEKTKHPVHFAGVVDEGVVSSISHRKLLNHHANKLKIDDGLSVCRPLCITKNDAEISLARSVTSLESLLRSSHRLVGGPLRTICTLILLTSDRLDHETSNWARFAVFRIRNSEGIHVHRGRCFIWLVPFYFIRLVNPNHFRDSLRLKL